MDTRQPKISSKDLSHAGSDKEFSSYWYGSPNYLKREDYPEWIAFCRQIAWDFDEGAPLKYLSQLRNRLGIPDGSQCVQCSDDPCYSQSAWQYNTSCQFMAEQQIVSQPVMINPDKFKKELYQLWDVKSFEKLFEEYLRYRYNQNKYVCLF